MAQSYSLAIFPSSEGARTTVILDNYSSSIVRNVIARVVLCQRLNGTTDTVALTIISSLFQALNNPLPAAKNRNSIYKHAWHAENPRFNILHLKGLRDGRPT